MAGQLAFRPLALSAASVPSRSTVSFIVSYPISSLHLTYSGHAKVCATNLLRLCGLVFDPQGLQQLGVNPSADRQSLRRLECSNRLAAARADRPVYPAVVITAPGKFRLH